jgi:hypothetical protein
MTAATEELKANWHIFKKNELSTGITSGNTYLLHGTVVQVKFTVQSADHELIPTRNASLAAIQGSMSGSNVRYYPT